MVLGYKTNKKEGPVTSGQVVLGFYGVPVSKGFRKGFRRENCQNEVGLGGCLLAALCVSEIKLGVVVQACSPCTCGGRGRRMLVPGQPELYSQMWWLKTVILAFRRVLRGGSRVKAVISYVSSLRLAWVI